MKEGLNGLGREGFINGETLKKFEIFFTWGMLECEAGTLVLVVHGIMGIGCRGCG